MRAIKLFLGEKVRLPALIWISILTCIGIGRIRIHGYDNFLKNPIRGYIYYLFKKSNKNNNNASLTIIVLGKPTTHLSTICDTKYVLPVPYIGNDCHPSVSGSALAHKDGNG
jgi:hypothetical protein